MDVSVFILIFIGIFGLIVGSFLNVLAWRLPEEEGVVAGRSRCRSCGKTLAWFELIPVLSYIMQRGRCRSCQSHVSIQYPLVELTCALLFVAAFRHITSYELPVTSYELQVTSYELLVIGYYFFAIACLIVIFVTDLKHFLILDAIAYPAIVISMLLILTNGLVDCHLPLITCSVKNAGLSLIGAGFFLALVLVSGGAWMGLGDVKLAAFMGLLLGPTKLFIALAIAFFLGSLVGMALIALKQKTMKSEVPFGTFLVPATLVALFFGDSLLSYFYHFSLF
ncbi:MAG: prepilin peptidase [bacterium]|nr:prepilin peptidase [bacterium]